MWNLCSVGHVSLYSVDHVIVMWSLLPPIYPFTTSFLPLYTSLLHYPSTSCTVSPSTSLLPPHHYLSFTPGSPLYTTNLYVNSCHDYSIGVILYQWRVCLEVCIVMSGWHGHRVVKRLHSRDKSSNIWEIIYNYKWRLLTIAVYSKCKVREVFITQGKCTGLPLSNKSSRSLYS